MPIALLFVFWKHDFHVFIKSIFISETPRCNVNGICSQGTRAQVGESPSTSVQECISRCKIEPECAWSTYDPNLEICHMFSTCQHIKTTTDNDCTNCVTNNKNCDCWVHGTCDADWFDQDKAYAYKGAMHASDCADLCKHDPKCLWSTFMDEPFFTCGMFTNCRNFNTTCLNTIPKDYNWVLPVDCQTYKKDCPWPIH